MELAVLEGVGEGAVAADEDARLDELEGAGPLGQLVVEVVGEAGALELGALADEGGGGVGRRVGQDVLLDEGVAVGPLLDLRFEEVLELGFLQVRHAAVVDHGDADTRQDAALDQLLFWSSLG